jgi:hypothetical protein
MEFQCRARNIFLFGHGNEVAEMAQFHCPASIVQAKANAIALNGTYGPKMADWACVRYACPSEVWTMA